MEYKILNYLINNNKVEFTKYDLPIISNVFESEHLDIIGELLDKRFVKEIGSVKNKISGSTYEIETPLYKINTRGKTFVENKTIEIEIQKRTEERSEEAIKQSKKSNNIAIFALIISLIAIFISLN